MSSRSFKRAMCAWALASTVATSAVAALSPKHEEWRKGPEQWIMTPEEQKAWRNVRTDEQAVDFIDLFWVRRDPTPQTAKNEFRDEFQSRVRFADQKFTEGKRRGSLTDRGRVFIVLGQPTNSSSELAFSSHHSLGSQSAGNPGGGSRMRGGRDVWTWEHDDAAKFGMPKIEVVFVERIGKGIYRDPQRPDFMSAMPVAIRKTITNPEVTEVPSWAPRGGLEPKILVVTETPITTTGPAEPKVTAVIGGALPTPLESAPSSLGAGTASRLTLLRSVYDIETETKVDPFTGIVPVAAFKAQEDLGWAAQYCAPGEDEPTVRFGLRLTGRAHNEVIDRLAPPDEIVPDRMRAVPGCFMLRGIIPLEGMSPGSYELELSILDASGSAKSVLKQAFRIE